MERKSHKLKCSPRVYFRYVKEWGGDKSQPGLCLHKEDVRNYESIKDLLFFCFLCDVSTGITV